MIKSQVFNYVVAHGYVAVWTAFLFELLALPLPGETIMTYMGYLVSQGKLSWGMSILAVSLGAMTGISLSYVIGSRVGSPLVYQYGHFLRLDPEGYERAARWFARHGKKMIILAYFVPGLRHISGYLSGILKMSFPLFALHAYVGAVLYAAVFVSLGKYLGSDWEKLWALASTHINAVALGIIIVILVCLWWRKYETGRDE